MLNEIREYEQYTVLPEIQIITDLKKYNMLLDDNNMEAEAYIKFANDLRPNFRVNYRNLTNSKCAGVDRALTIVTRKFLFGGGNKNFIRVINPNEDEQQYNNARFSATEELLAAWLGYDYAIPDGILTEEGKELYKEVENFFPSYVLYLLAWKLDGEIKKDAFNTSLKNNIENYGKSGKTEKKSLEELKKELDDKKRKYGIHMDAFSIVLDKISEVLAPGCGKCDLNSAVKCCKVLYDSIIAANTARSSDDVTTSDGMQDAATELFLDDADGMAAMIQKINKNVLIKIQRDKSKYRKPVFNETIGDDIEKNDARMSTFGSIIATALDLGQLKNRIMLSHSEIATPLSDLIKKYSKRKRSYGKPSKNDKDSMLRLIAAYLIIMEQNARGTSGNKMYACATKADIANWCLGDPKLETKTLELFYYDSTEECRIVEDVQIIGGNSFKFKINPSLISKLGLTLKEDNREIISTLKPNDVIYRDLGSGKDLILE